jgi:hypothetical protein
LQDLTLKNSIKTLKFKKKILSQPISTTRKKKEYSQIYLEYEIDEIDSNFLYSHPFWLESSKKGKFIYRASKSLVNKESLGGSQPLFRGWNFLAINDNFYQKSLDELSGNCSVLKSYDWNSQEQNWFVIDINDKLDLGSQDFLTGKGLILKVENDCGFVPTEEEPLEEPPPEEPSTDTDFSFFNYNVKGTTSGYNTEGNYITHTDYCEENTLYEGGVDKTCRIVIEPHECLHGCDAEAGACKPTTLPPAPGKPTGNQIKCQQAEAENSQNLITGNVISNTNSPPEEVSLKKGWNLFSLPIKEKMTFGNLKKQCPNKIVGNLWGFKDGSYYSPSEIKPGEGYWVYLKEDCELTFEESQLANTPITDRGIQLKSGWNLIGSSAIETEIADLTKTSCNINSEMFEWYNDGENSFFTSEFTTLSSGKGYWVEVEGDCELREKPETEIIVLKENYEKELIKPNPPEHFNDWNLNILNIQNRVSEITSEPYDFLLMVPTVSGNSFSSRPANRDIKGIGNDFVSYHDDPNLKNIITLPLNSPGFFSANTFSDRLVKGLILHELGHHWLAYVNGFFSDPKQSMGGHYKSNVDLFYGVGNIDPMSNTRWFSQDGAKKCVNSNDLDFNGEIKFSKLSLYLMGLIPPGEVPAINVFDYEGEQFFAGPGCNGNHVWTNTREIAISDIIAANGERIPSYENSQKHFEALFVIVIPYNEMLPEGYVEYVEQYRRAIPQAWAEATSDKSTIKV